MSRPTKNRHWILAKRPIGDIDEEKDLQLTESEIPILNENEFLVHIVLISLDPTNRIWMSDDPQYMPPVQIGQIMRSFAFGKVIESKNEGYAVGTWVAGMFGWQEFVVVKEASKLQVGNWKLPLSGYPALISFIGFTSYFGVLNVAGGIKPTDTVVIDAAAGAVGSLAGQIAKLHGCRVVGIAGSDDKCNWLKQECGFDVAINYKASDFKDQLKAAVPNGIDFVFENVGGDIFDSILLLMNLKGRISLCGLISQYNSTNPIPTKQFAMVLHRRLNVEGFIVTDFADKWGEAAVQLYKWWAEGKIKYRTDINFGLENAPKVLKKLYQSGSGSNSGKLILKTTNIYDNEIEI